MRLADGRTLDDDELLALWRHGRHLATRYCRGSLARLRSGAGGFYEVDDFWQDAFLAFCQVVAEWQALGRPTDDLWRRWGLALWGQGIHILRRAPQRLWSGVQSTTDSGQAVDGEPAVVQKQPQRPGQPRLTGSESARRSAEQNALALDRLDDLEGRLWRLRPLQRQALYMAALQHMPAAKVASRLGLRDRREAYRLVENARRRLRRSGVMPTAHARRPRGRV